MGRETAEERFEARVVAFASYCPDGVLSAELGGTLTAGFVGMLVLLTAGHLC